MPPLYTLHIEPDRRNRATQDSQSVTGPTCSTHLQGLPCLPWFREGAADHCRSSTADPPWQILHGSRKREKGKWGNGRGMHLLKSKLSTLKDHPNNSVSLAPSSKVWQGGNLQPILAATMSFQHFADQPWSLPFPSPYRHQSDFTGTDTHMAHSTGQDSGSQHGQHRIYTQQRHTHTTTQCIAGPPPLIPTQ